MDGKIQSLAIGTSLRSPMCNYRIEKIIGHGSFGITYLASTKVKMQGPLGELETEMKVAIKEFFLEEMSTRNSSTGVVSEATEGSLIKRYSMKFRKEAENLSRLHHPNIVKVMEVFSANNTNYYVMEFLEGQSLDEYVLSRGGLSETEAKAAIGEIATALKYMHSQKMLHLDLKPKNVMRRKDGHLILIDFGLSKQYDEHGEPDSSTTIGLGTPGYAPIEQANAMDNKVFAATLDIYALGATFFKLLTAQTPPKASDVLNDRSIIADQLQQRHVSKATIAIIANMMSPEKVNRPQSVDAFIKMLRGQYVPPRKEDEETEIKKKTILVEPEMPDDASEDEKTPLVKSKKFWVSVIVGFIVVFILFSLYKAGTKDTRDMRDEAGIETTTEAQDMPIKDANGIVLFTYSGPTVNNQPQGVGKAVYTDGRVYEGPFENGVRQGKNAKLTYTNGDVFTGSFEKDHLGKGSYRSSDGKSTFKGIFLNDQPYTGTWYDKSGNVFSTMKDGQTQ